MNQHRRLAQRRVEDKVRSKLELFIEHQATLDTKNHELRNVRLELEELRDHYSELVEFAPVGYLILNKTGHIQSINLTGSTLLRKDRTILTGKPFTNCLPQTEHQIFLSYLKKIFNASRKIAIDLTIGDAHDRPNLIRLESFLKNDTATFRRVIITDISQFTRISKYNHALLKENRRLIKNAFQVQEEERRLLARELHDELGQWLTAIRTNNETILSGAQAILENTQEMYTGIHRILKKLRPALLDTLGLEDALLELKHQWCKHHQHINLEIKLEGKLDKLGEPLNIAIFRIFQEGLTNIGSHSKATWAQISLRRKTTENAAVDCLLLTIEDNGNGYDTNQKSTGLGLLGMRERVIAIGGTISVNSAHNEGTKIDINLSVDKEFKQ